MILNDVLTRKIQEQVLLVMEDMDRTYCVEQIARELHVTTDLAAQLIEAPVWNTTFAMSAADALGMTIEFDLDEYADVPRKYTPEQHEIVCSCIDCGVNTMTLGEYYCLIPQSWYSATAAEGGDGMLCLGCIEVRLGRSLTQEDFEVGVPINHYDVFYKRSDRFIDRLSKTQKIA